MLRYKNSLLERILLEKGRLHTPIPDSLFIYNFQVSMYKQNSDLKQKALRLHRPVYNLQTHHSPHPYKGLPSIVKVTADDLPPVPGQRS